MENRSKKKAGSPRRQPSKRARLVRRAEKYMRANLGKPLSLLDLCREVGVSERTLYSRL